MALIGSILVKMGLQSAAFNKGLQDAQKEAKKFAKETKSVLDEMKQRFGEDSSLGKWMKAAKGAGAVAAIDMLGKGFNNATSALGGFIDRWNSGESFKSIAAEGVRSLPVLSGFIKGFDDLRGIVTGTRSEMQKLNAEIAKQDEYTARMAKGLSAATSAKAIQENAARAYAKEAAVFGKSGFDAKNAALAFEEQERMAELQKQLDAELQKTAIPQARQSIRAAINSAMALEQQRFTLLRENLRNEENAELAKQMQEDAEKKAEDLKRLNETIDKGLNDFFSDIEKSAVEKAEKLTLSPTQYSAAKEQRFGFTYRAAKEAKDPLADISRKQLEVQTKALSVAQDTKAILAKEQFSEATL